MNTENPKERLRTMNTGNPKERLSTMNTGTIKKNFFFKRQKGKKKTTTTKRQTKNGGLSVRTANARTAESHVSSAITDNSCSQCKHRK